jgi:integrase
VTELVRLRVGEVDVERGLLTVRGGKGDKDRVTVLPKTLRGELLAHRERLRGLWEKDRALGLPGVWLPPGVAFKHAKVGEEWPWQWFFPSREVSQDPVSGIWRRHHTTVDAVQRGVKAAGERAGLAKKVTPHVLRHSFATHVLEAGTPISTVQELLGHSHLDTTRMYLQVMRKPEEVVRSPLDGLRRMVSYDRPGDEAGFMVEEYYEREEYGPDGEVRVAMRVARVMKVVVRY